MESITIGERTVSAGAPPYVIAEAGSNHNGDLSIAKRLIEKSAKAGADAVKFQLFRADELYSPKAGSASTVGDSVTDVLERLEVPYEWLPTLAEHCEEFGVTFLVSPFDRESADALKPYIPAYKVASTLITHEPFLDHLADHGKPLIVSTGASSLDDVRKLVSFIESRGVPYALLQCVSSYPTPIDRANIAVIDTFREEFGWPAGLSDHTEDPTLAPVVATARGAAIIEKHVTLDRTMEGPDHSFAIEPDELADLVSRVSEARASLGDREKHVLDIESETHENGRRCLHAAVSLAEGDVLTEESIAILRPGEQVRGLEPDQLSEVLGRKVTTRVDEGAVLREEFVDL